MFAALGEPWVATLDTCVLAPMPLCDTLLRWKPRLKRRVDGYEHLVANMTNHPKDRHVLAAAVQSGAQTIVTFNVKDFDRRSLAPYDIAALTPDQFLLEQLRRHQQAVADKLLVQAAARGLAREDLLVRLSRSAPRFVRAVR